MSTTVAIALDAVPPELIERWMDDGRLPRLARLRAQGSFGRLRKEPLDPHDASWSIFLAGASPALTGHWTHNGLDSRTYAFKEDPAYDFRDHAPFYRNAAGRRIALFDVPLAAIEPGLPGVQVLGWGLEANQYLRVSEPPELMDEIVARHGPHPAYAGLGDRRIGEDGGAAVHGFRNPSLYDDAALDRLARELIAGARVRADIIVDLLSRERWDLLLAAYGETHIAGHLLWHRGLPHPLNDTAAPDPGGMPALAELLAAIDEGIGRIDDALPPGATLVVFSVSGMRENAVDLPNTLFLPEALHRLQFGRATLCDGDPDSPPPAPARHYRAHWKDEVWALRTDYGEQVLASPASLEASGDALDWNPARWFQPRWPQMQAFALPTYLLGTVRLNVRGREGSGVVEPRDYRRTVEELAAALAQLTDARTGRSIVREVLTPKRDPFETVTSAPPGDLTVVWRNRDPSDVVEAPGIGRIGPAPWFRSGGHSPTGFCLARGPGVPVGSRFERARVVDLSATLAAALGTSAPVGGRLW